MNTTQKTDDMIGPEYIHSDAPVHASHIETSYEAEKIPKVNTPGGPEFCPVDDEAPLPPSQAYAMYGNEKACMDRAIDPMSTKTKHSNSPSEITSIDTEQNLEITQAGNDEEVSAVTTPRARAPIAPSHYTPVEQANTSNTPPLPSLDSSTMDQIALSTLYSVEATLVPDTTSVQINDEPTQSPAPVYNAVLVTEQTPKPWWKRRQYLVSIVLALLVIVLVITLSVLIPGDDDPPDDDPDVGPVPEAEGTVKLHPNHSESCAVFNEALFQSDCNNCQPNVDVDGSTVVVAKNYEYVRFLSVASGKLEVISSFSIDYAAWIVVISGNTTMIGGGNNTGEGTVHVYEKNDTGWYEISVIEPSDIDKSAWFGRAISFDGDKMVVGAVADRDVGSVFIYQVNDAYGWELATKLTPDIPHLRNFGRIVSIKDDIIAVGDRIYGDPRKGAVFIYTLNATSSSWNMVANVTNSDCDQWFGTSVSILDAALVIGCPREDGGIGAAYYYQGDHYEGQYELVQKMQASNGTYYDNFAHNNQLATDGENIMAIGTNRKWNGAVYLYTLMNGEWLEFAKINEPGTTEHFGDVVDLSGNNMVIASANNVYFYSVEECLSLL